MSGKLLVSIIIGLLVVLVGGYFVIGSLYPTAPLDASLEPFDEVQVQDITVGDGDEAVPGSLVSVLYVGRLEDGTVFDSSEAYENEPLTFILGEPGLIPGFQIGINGMREGGERIMAIPASLGYGDSEVQDPDGNVIIPANSILIFSVTLVSVESEPQINTEETEDEDEAVTI